MLAIFLETLPFFAVIGLGYGAARRGVFSEEATSALTRFVFYFALSAMLFRFAANLSFDEIYDPVFMIAYLLPTAGLYLLATIVALVRRRGLEEAAVEAQCAVIGNIGFLGIPMLVLIMGEYAVGPIVAMLAVDLVVFSSLIVILIVGSRDGRLSPKVLLTVGLGLLKNPMIVSISLGMIWSAMAWPIPAPANAFLELLGSAATPCALFAIGASLASKSAERLSAALWLSTSKLILHPILVAISALLIFPVEPRAAGVLIASAAMPVAGNIFMIAHHYNVAPQRVSAAILVSTVVSVATVSITIAWIENGPPAWMGF